MSHFSFKLPDLGEGIVVSEIVQWHVKVGDKVAEDQHIVDVMTDKAVVEVTSPVSGTVEKLACDEGIEIPVGSELILFVTQNSQSLDAVNNTPLETLSVNPTSTNDAVYIPAAASVNHKPDKALKTILNSLVLTSPSVRKHARQKGIDLTLVSGTGHSGRINNSDLTNFIDNGAQQVSSTTAHETTNTLHNTNTTAIKIKGLRKVIAQRMQQTKRNVPHYSYIEEIDLSALETLRKHLNTQRKDTQSKLTILPFIMQALVKVLADFPHCNALYNDQDEILTQYNAVHIGIATMTDQGLMVPVIKNSDTLDLWQSAAQLAQLTALTRAGKANSAQLTGSTITITSLGAIGGIATTPIINAPETTIIGINKMQQRPMVINGQIEIRTMMNLSASFDHRIVDGYDGALLIQALKKLLENPGAIFV
ncbi:MAG: dihydrolipoamide acetyltransferase family protein [Oceanospirillaceae bacterium]